MKTQTMTSFELGGGGLFSQKPPCIKGFTLAEVLITLGIIGIAAAMTLPTLTAHNRTKVLQTQLKKAYADLQEVNLRIIADGHDLMETDLLDVSSRVNLVMPYFNGKAALADYTGYQNARSQLTKIYGGKGLYRNDMQIITSPICDNGGVWIDNIGRLWMFNDADRQICVDINGAKGPNKYGYDFFVFYPQKGKIVPHFTDIENEYSENSTAFADYTYYALIDQHPEDSSKTYWKDFIKMK